jgi:hypothetical protein
MNHQKRMQKSSDSQSHIDRIIYLIIVFDINKTMLLVIVFENLRDFYFLLFIGCYSSWLDAGLGANCC